MASSSSLYGAPRPKSKSISLSSTSIHALSTEITLARLSSGSSSGNTAPGRPRRLKTKSLFTNPNKGVNKRAARDLVPDEGGKYGGKTTAQLGGGISERDLARSRKKLKEKSRLYASMKRGDFNDDNNEGLVDFDRKWAEHPSDEESESEEDVDGDDQIVEYEDEFGRIQKAKGSVVNRMKQHEATSKKAAEELAALNAVPERLIVGNTIQTSAFLTPTFSGVPTSSMLSSALPVEKPADLETHYDASKEVRTKGVGFYNFSKDSEGRAAQFEDLGVFRRETVEGKERVEEKRRRRKEEGEKKREEVKRRRREKVGDKWLEGFMGDLLGEPQKQAD